MSKGSTWLLSDERYLTDPAPLLLALKRVRGQGLFWQEYLLRQFKHTRAQNKPHSALHIQDHVAINPNLSTEAPRWSWLSCLRGLLPTKCHVSGGAPGIYKV